MADQGQKYSAGAECSGVVQYQSYCCNFCIWADEKVKIAQFSTYFALHNISQEQEGCTDPHVH